MKNFKTIVILVTGLLLTIMSAASSDPHQECWEECIDMGGSAAFCEEICWTDDVRLKVENEMGQKDFQYLGPLVPGVVGISEAESITEPKPRHTPAEKRMRQ